MFKHDKLNLFLFVALVGLQVLGVVALWTRFQWTYLPIMLFMYFWAGISTTLYLHRYLTHRGFEMPGWLKFIFATGSAVALSGDPVTWVGDHRYHHLKSDTDEDIHSPLHGFPYAHMMWLVRKPPGFRDKSLRYAADVRKIWYCRLWERPYLYVLPHLSVAALLYFTLGGVGPALVPLRADARRLQFHLGGELDLPHAFARLPQFRDDRSEQKQLLGRTRRFRRGLPQQPPRQTALRSAWVEMVGV